MESSLNQDGEAQTPSGDLSRKRGGWITFPFITGTMAGLSLAAGGWMMNLVVYLIEEFNVKSIDAAQIYNVINGCTTLFPIIGAIIADSFLGLFPVISISSLISLLGTVLLTLTAKISSLRPPNCETGSILCKSPSKGQLAILFSSLALASIGVGGTRYTIGTIGGNQFDKPKDQGIFFNWFFFTMYTSIIVSVTAIIYVEDSVSWGLGFGICIVANLFGLAIFVAGRRYYRIIKPQGSPFMGLASVVVATIRKRKANLSLKSEDYYHGPKDGEASKVVGGPAIPTKTFKFYRIVKPQGSPFKALACVVVAAFKKRKASLSRVSHEDYYYNPKDEDSKVVGATPTNTFKFLNRAALKAVGDSKSDGSIAKPWSLCSVQQVEDFKALIRIVPVLSTAIFLSVPIGIQGSLFVLQALTMDRRFTQHSQIPAGSMVVFQQISICFFVALIDRVIYPMWQKLKGHPPTHLQRIGFGHVIIILSMIVSALVESRRLKIAHSYELLDGSAADMSVFWLVVPLLLIGAGEAFHFPGQIGLYYQEFPASLKSTSTAMVALLIAIAYYAGTAIVDLVRRVTRWLPDDINKGRVDNVYWMLVVVAVVNYGYFLVCSWFYEYKNGDQKLENDTSDS